MWPCFQAACYTYMIKSHILLQCGRTFCVVNKESQQDTNISPHAGEAANRILQHPSLQ